MEREVVARHAAGHAVMARWVGVPFEYVTLELSTESFVPCRATPLRTMLHSTVEVDRRMRDRIEGSIMWALAGPLAEEALTGRFDEVGGMHDLDIVRELAAYASRGDAAQAEPLVAWLRARTAAELRDPFAARWVEKVANRLMKVERLSSSEVARLGVAIADGRAFRSPVGFAYERRVFV